MDIEQELRAESEEQKKKWPLWVTLLIILTADAAVVYGIYRLVAG